MLKKKMKYKLFHHSFLPNPSTNTKDDQLPRISLMINSINQNTISLIDTTSEGDNNTQSVSSLNKVEDLSNIKLKSIRYKTINQRISLKSQLPKPINLYSPTPSNKYCNTPIRPNNLYYSIDSFSNVNANPNYHSLTKFNNNSISNKSNNHNRHMKLADEVGEEAGNSNSIKNSNHYNHTITDKAFPQIKSDVLCYHKQLNTTKDFIWSKCDEIQNDCSSFEKGVKKKPSKVLRTKITSVQKKYGVIKSNIDELNQKKKRKQDIIALSKLKTKNKQILRESECVHRLSNDLAFKGQSLLQNIFKVKKEGQVENKPNLPNIKIVSKKKMKEMSEISEQSRIAIKRINKMCIKFAIFN